MFHICAAPNREAAGPQLLVLLCLATTLACSRGDRDVVNEAVAIHIHPSTAMLQKQGHNATRASRGTRSKPTQDASWFRRRKLHWQDTRPQERGGWDFTDNMYCSKSDPETVKIEEDQHGNSMKKRQWGRTASGCAEDCKQNPACKAYTFGIWEKGLWRMFGGHNGDTRCQLYEACGENRWKGMTLAYTKDAPVKPAGIVEDNNAPDVDDDDVGSGDGGNGPPPPPPPVDETVDLGPEVVVKPKKEPWDGEELFRPGSEGDKQDKLAKKIMQTVVKELTEQTDSNSNVYKALDKADKEGKAFHELLRKQRDAAAAALGAAKVMHNEVKNDTNAMESLLHNFKTKTMGQDKIIAAHPRFSPDFGEDDD